MTDKAFVDTAVVLAGGIGSRLFPLTKNKPKPLIPVGNYPMLDWNLFVLEQSGIKDVIIVVKYLGEQIIEYIAKNKHRFPKLTISTPKVNPRDTADALRQVSHLIPADCERFFVTMADIVTNINLKDMAQVHKEKHSMATISLKSIEGPRSFGVIVLDENSQILLFLEKPSPQELYMTTLMFMRKKSVHYYANLVNTGIYLFERDILKILNEYNDLLDFGKQVFPFMLERNLPIFGYSPPARSDYYWLDCGRHEQLLWANWDVARRYAWPYLPRGNEHDGSWWGDNLKFGLNFKFESPIMIGDNVTFEDNTLVKQFTAIGNNCIIGTHTTISAAVIENNVIIGKNCTIEKAIVAEGTIIGNNVTIKEKAVIGANVQIIDNTIIEAGSVIETTS